MVKIVKNPGNGRLNSGLRPVLFCIFFFREKNVYNFVDALRVTGLKDVPDGPSVCGELTANNIRNKVADYFLTDVRATSWQM
jgi:hypothetical protein